MDALHIREIQLYSYNQLQFLTEHELGRRKGWRERGRRRRNMGGNHLHRLCEILLLIWWQWNKSCRIKIEKTYQFQRELQKLFFFFFLAILPPIHSLPLYPSSLAPRLSIFPTVLNSKPFPSLFSSFWSPLPLITNSLAIYIEGSHSEEGSMSYLNI